MGINEVSLINAEEVGKLSFVNVNGALFFGAIEVEIEENRVLVTNAIAVDNTEIVPVLKAWLKAKNSGSLKNPVFGGSSIAYGVEDISETDKFKIASFIASANFKLKSVFSDLANNVIDSTN